MAYQGQLHPSNPTIRPSNPSSLQCHTTQSLKPVKGTTRRAAVTRGPAKNAITGVCQHHMLEKFGTVSGPLAAQGVIADDRCLSKRRREADRPPQANGHWT